MAEETVSSILKDDVVDFREERATDDFSKETGAMIDRFVALKQQGQLNIGASIFDEFFALEKKCRQAQDSQSGAKLCSCYLSCLLTITQKDGSVVEIDTNTETILDPFDSDIMIRACQAKAGYQVKIIENQNIAFVSENILLIMKKRGQLKRSIVAAARFALQLIEYLDLPDKILVINAITSATEGKMFVEVERARLLLHLSLIKEHQNLTSEAANILQEIQVETFGGMDRHEKTNFILKQMALLLTCGDYIRCHIASKKINPKLLEPEDMTVQKIRYFKAMTDVHLHNNDLLDAALSYKCIFETATIQQDQEKWREALESYILLLCMAEHDDQAIKLRSEILSQEEKKLRHIESYEQILKDLAQSELMQWPLSYENALKAHFLFSDQIYVGGAQRWDLLRQRVVQHNLGVLSKHYIRITMGRIANLLGVTVEETETELCNIVCNGRLHAKIDRPNQVVEFGSMHTASDTLSEWSDNITKLLDHVDTCCHMIQKERLVHAARSKSTVGART